MVITHITIYPSINSEVVVLKTDLPKPQTGAAGDTLLLVYTCKPGTAEEYVRTNFPDVEYSIEMWPAAAEEDDNPHEF